MSIRMMADTTQPATTDTTPQALTVDDVIRVTFTPAIGTKTHSFRAVVLNVTHTDDRTTVTLSNPDGSPKATDLHIEPDGTARLPVSTRGNDFPSYIDATVDIVGAAPDSFGAHTVQFRAAPHRDHLLRTTLYGTHNTVCHYTVNTDDGEHLPLTDLTTRHRAVLDLCHACQTYAENNVADALPAHPTTTDQTGPIGDAFPCPECGEPAESTSYDETRPAGMYAHHADGRDCGPWDPDYYLAWRARP